MKTQSSTTLFSLQRVALVAAAATVAVFSTITPADAGGKERLKRGVDGTAKMARKFACHDAGKVTAHGRAYGRAVGAYDRLGYEIARSMDRRVGPYHGLCRDQRKR